MSRKIILAALVALTSLSLSGCIGRSAKQTTTVRATTTGQELEDLQTALDKGLIDQKEYDKKRKEILAQ